MINHCKDCRHRQMVPFMQGFTVAPGFGICGRIPHADDVGKDDPAYVQDAEDYSASVRVAENFGCVLWEPKQ